MPYLTWIWIFGFFSFPFNSLAHKTETYKDEFGIHTFCKKGFFLPRINYSLVNKWSLHFLDLFETYCKKHSKPDIIHAHNYLGGLGAYHIKKKYGIPYVVTEHSTAFLDDSIPKHHKHVVSLAYDHANEVMGVSPALSDKLLQWTGTTVSTIPNFIDTNLFTPVQTNSGTFRFIFAGDFVKRKNLFLLVDAAAKLADFNMTNIEVLLAGTGSIEKELKSRVTQLGLTNIIHFLGQRTQEELAADIQQSNVLVLPSFHETFGLVLVEAMSCGIPVISTKSGGPDSIVSESTGILLEDFSTTTLFMAMKKMIENYHLYSKDNIRSYVINKYSVDAVYPKLLALYNSI